MNIAMLLAHSMEEYDQLKLLSGLGYDVFSIGGYIDPRHPHDDKRPALPDIPYHPELKAVVDGLGAHDNLTAAKEHIPDAILDWADVVVVHHYEHRWIVPDWERLRGSGKRIIWRTVGQSAEHNERMMAPLHAEGLEIVRYSPKERNIPGYAGEDALIRFYKDPAEWYGWTGDWTVYHDNQGPVVGTTGKGSPFVTNVTQKLRERDPFTNYGFWRAATEGLEAVPAGPGSETIGGLGTLGYEGMRELLRGARAYLTCGTQPASYTLSLIEAMMTGIPVVSIAPQFMGLFPYSPDLYEGLEITQLGPLGEGSAEGAIIAARNELRQLLGLPFDKPARGYPVGWGYPVDYPLDGLERAQWVSGWQRQRAIELFGRETIGRQWLAYLGQPATMTVQGVAVPA